MSSSRNQEESTTVRKIAEDAPQIQITKQLADKVKAWHADGAAIKLPSSNEELSALIRNEKNAEYSLDWENTDEFIKKYKTNSQNPELYQNDKNMLYAAAGLKTKQLSMDEFADIVFRYEMANACGHENVETLLLINESGELTDAGHAFFKNLEAAFRRDIDPIIDDDLTLREQHYHILNDMHNKLKLENLPEEQFNEIFAKKCEEYANMHYAMMDQWLTQLKEALIKLYKVSPSLCVAHKIKEKAYEAQKEDEFAILRHIGFTTISPGLVISDPGSSEKKNNPNNNEELNDDLIGDRWLMSIGLMQEWGKIIGNGGYRLVPTLGELSVEEVEKMDKNHVHPLAISYAKTSKMTSADSLNTSPFSATLHDIYHFIQKARLSPQFQNILEFVKHKLQTEFKLNVNKMSQEEWLCIDKNITVPLLKPCVEKREFLTVLKDMEFDAKLFILLDSLKNPEVWQANNIEPVSMIQDFYNDLINPESENKPSKFKLKILAETFKQYLDGNEQIKAIINSDESFGIKVLKLILISHGQNELESLTPLLEEVDKLLTWRQTGIARSSDLRNIELTINNMSLFSALEKQTISCISDEDRIKQIKSGNSDEEKAPKMIAFLKQQVHDFKNNNSQINNQTFFKSGSTSQIKANPDPGQNTNRP